MSSSQHGLAERHQVGHAMSAIADQLCLAMSSIMTLPPKIRDERPREDYWQLSPDTRVSSRHHSRSTPADTHHRFGMIQLDAPRQSPLGEDSQLRYEEFVELPADQSKCLEQYTWHIETCFSRNQLHRFDPGRSYAM